MGAGVSSVALDETRLQVSSTGNSYTSPETIKLNLLRKAAEETIRLGYTAYRVDFMQDRGRTVSFNSPGSSTTTNIPMSGVNKDSAVSLSVKTTSSGVGEQHSTYLPGMSANVTMLKDAPARPQAGVFVAADVIRVASENQGKRK